MRYFVLLAPLFLFSLLPAAVSEEKKNETKPRKLPEIKSVITKLMSVVQKGEDAAYDKPPSHTGKIVAGKMKKASLEAALARLKIYRYLAGLPYEDITIGEKFNEGAQHAAVLMAIMGKLSHTPSKPAGVPDDFFKLAYDGASHSNLHQGQSNLVSAVDGWMNDSDKTNIDRLGHRRWFLNPTMKEVGFGLYNGFAAAWVVGGDRGESPDYDFIAFPAQGIHPWQFFGANWAWSVSLNPRKYRKPQKGEIKIAVFAEKGGRKSGTPLRLTDVNVDYNAFGTPHCIIFRPVLDESAPRSTYIVEIAGVRDSGGGEKTVSYRVAFAE